MSETQLKATTVRAYLKVLGRAGMLEQVAARLPARWFSRESLKEMMPLLAPMVTGVLRLIGTSPSTVFKRMNDLVKSNIRGVDYRWEASGRGRSRCATR